MSSERIIPRRDAIEVFVNEGGNITIKQPDLLGGDDAIVEVFISDVDTLCAFLLSAKEEAMGVPEDKDRLTEIRSVIDRLIKPAVPAQP